MQQSHVAYPESGPGQEKMVSLFLILPFVLGCVMVYVGASQARSLSSALDQAGPRVPFTGLRMMEEKPFEANSNENGGKNGRIAGLTKVLLERNGIQRNLVFGSVEFIASGFYRQRGVEDSPRDCICGSVLSDLSRIMGTDDDPPVAINCKRFRRQSALGQGGEGTLQAWVEEATMEVVGQLFCIGLYGTRTEESRGKLYLRTRVSFQDASEMGPDQLSLLGPFGLMAIRGMPTRSVTAVVRSMKKPGFCRSSEPDWYGSNFEVTRKLLLSQAPEAVFSPGHDKGQWGGVLS